MDNTTAIANLTGGKTSYNLTVFSWHEKYIFG